MEEAEEAGALPVLFVGQGEDGPQLVEGDVAVWERAHQMSLLESGPLLLQGQSAPHISLKAAT